MDRISCCFFCSWSVIGIGVNFGMFGILWWIIDFSFWVCFVWIFWSGLIRVFWWCIWCCGVSLVLVVCVWICG